MNARNDSIVELRRQHPKWSYEAIAATVGCTRGVVAGVLHRAGVTDPKSSKAIDTPRPRRFGERNSYAKLSAGDVRLIRSVYRPRCPRYGATALALRFGVVPKTIEAVFHGRSWAHVQ